MLPYQCRSGQKLGNDRPGKRRRYHIEAYFIGDVWIPISHREECKIATQMSVVRSHCSLWCVTFVW